MSKSSLDLRQLRHDLKGLIEPLETVKMLISSGKVEQADRIQVAAIEALKKIVQRVDEASSQVRGGDA